MTPASDSSTSCTWLYWMRSTRQVRASAPAATARSCVPVASTSDGRVGPHGVGQCHGSRSPASASVFTTSRRGTSSCTSRMRHGRRVQALQDAAGQQPADAPQLLEVEPDVEQRPAIGRARHDGEHRDARGTGRRDGRPQRRHHRVVAAYPQRLRATGHQRLHGLGDGGAAVHVGLEQLEAQRVAGLARLQRERLGVGLGRVPRHAARA